jgi:hypothetical protein
MRFAGFTIFPRSVIIDHLTRAGLVPWTRSTEPVGFLVNLVRNSSGWHRYRRWFLGAALVVNDRPMRPASQESNLNGVDIQFRGEYPSDRFVLHKRFIRCCFRIKDIEILILRLLVEDLAVERPRDRPGAINLLAQQSLSKVLANCRRLSIAPIHPEPTVIGLGSHIWQLPAALTEFDSVLPNAYVFFRPLLRC